MEAILRRALRKAFLRLPKREAICRLYGFLYRLFLGNDVFISYGRLDGSSYNEALDRQLARAGLVCYSDRRGASSGRRIPKGVLFQLAHSSVLVVLAGPKAAASKNVGREVWFFHKKNRPIIPINFGGALSEAKWRRFVENISPEEEDLSSLAEDPSPTPKGEVIQRIIRAEETVSRRRMLRQITRYIAGGILTLLLLSAGVTEFLIERAQEKQSEAQTEATWSKEQARRADRGRQKAEEEKSAAEEKRDSAVQAADQAQGEASRQQAIAEAIRMANEAEALRTGDSEELEKSSRTAVEALRRLQSLGVTSAEADRTLRRGVELLRPRIAEIPFLFSLKSVALSRDGRFIAMAADNVTLVRSLDRDDLPPVQLPLSQECCSVMAFTTSGRLAVADEGTLRLCSVWGEGAPRCENITDHCMNAAFSRDGDSFVSVESKGKETVATVWRLGDTPPTVSPHAVSEDLIVRHVALSEDGSYLAIGAYVEARASESIFLFDLTASPKALPQTFVATETSSPILPSIGAVAVTREGNALAAAVNSLGSRGADKVVVWDLDVTHEEKFFPTDSASYALAFGRGGQSLAISELRTIRLWDRETQSETARLLTNPNDAVIRDTLSMSADGRLLASSPLTGSVIVWRLDQDAEGSPWKKRQFPTAAALSRDGRSLARMDLSGGLVLDNLSTRTTRVLKNRVGGPLESKILFDGSSLVVTPLDGPTIAEIFEAGRNEEIPLPPLTQEVSFSQNKRLMALATFEKVEIRETGRSTSLGSIPGSEGALAVALAPAGTYVAVAGQSEVTIWEILRHANETGFRQVKSLPVRVVDSKRLLWDPRGTCLALRAPGKTLLWSASTPKVVTEIGEAIDFAISPDRRLFAVTASSEMLWGAEEPCSRPVWTSKLSGRPTQMTIHPSSTFAAIALADNTIEVWDLLRRKPVARLSSEAPLVDMVFTMDGRYLVTLDTTGTVRHELWRPEDLIEEALVRLRKGTLYLEPWDSLERSSSR